jgi:hypothetical protein
VKVVAQTTGESLDQSVGAGSNLQQDGSSSGTAIPLIELQDGALGENLGEQRTPCHAIVKHAEAFLLASNAV